MDVLGYPEFGDAGGLGRLQVPVGVLLREVLGGLRVRFVRAEMQVVVRQHPQTKGCLTPFRLRSWST